jgi:hypothetical protein
MQATNLPIALLVAVRVPLSASDSPARPSRAVRRKYGRRKSAYGNLVPKGGVVQRQSRNSPYCRRFPVRTASCKATSSVRVCTRLIPFPRWCTGVLRGPCLEQHATDCRQPDDDQSRGHRQPLPVAEGRDQDWGFAARRRGAPQGTGTNPTCRRACRT